MPGTRTAGTVDGTPPFQRVSYSFVDASEDIRSIAIQLPPGSTAAQIEAIGAQLQLLTNASLFKIEVTASYASAPDAGNAIEELHESVFDNVAMLLKDQVNHSQNFFVPAPILDLVPADSDTPIGLELVALVLALTAALEQGTTDDWQAVSARYTERREKNQRVLI